MMDFARMYIASPDWLKLIWILAPCLSAVLIAAIAGRAVSARRVIEGLPARDAEPLRLVDR